VYRTGNSSGIPADAWATLRRNPVFLKGPITTPQGSGYKSLNVTIRKTLGLFANVRPCRSFHPYVHTQHPDMDVVVVRENEEDLYAGMFADMFRRVGKEYPGITQEIQIIDIGRRAWPRCRTATT
jgi:isocitrate dehydrogenase